MSRALFPFALACAVFSAVPAAAQSVTVSSRSRGGPSVEIYVEAQSRGVPAAVLYDHARHEHHLIGRSAAPPVGSFAYFGTGYATEVAVVTDVYPDGTVSLLHHDPYGRAMVFQMNLRFPERHRRHGRVVNDYVAFAGAPCLAPVAFYGYALPPPRVVVVRHGGHRGYEGPRYHDPVVHRHGPPAHAPAHGYRNKHGHGHHHDHADRGRDRDDDDREHKHKDKKKKKKKDKKNKKRDHKHEDRDHDDHRSRKRMDA